VNTETAVAEYDEFRAKMDEVRDACNFIPDVSTDEGYEKSKRVALDVGKLLTALEKTRKETKSESLAFGKRVDAQAKSINEELATFQGPHKEAYQELDNAKKLREQKRKDELEERVRDIANLPDLMADMDSGAVGAALQALINNECLDFYEYSMQALEARKASQAKLSALFNAKLQQEKEQAELKQLRAAAQARERQDAEDAIAREATQKVEREAAEKIAQAEAEKNAVIARERAAEQARVDADEKERREQAKRNADREHCAGINRAAVEALENIGGVDCGLSPADAKAVVTAIAKNQIPAIKIKY
jgi:colicin import membrane protein